MYLKTFLKILIIYAAIINYYPLLLKKKIYIPYKKEICSTEATCFKCIYTAPVMSLISHSEMGT